MIEVEVEAEDWTGAIDDVGAVVERAAVSAVGEETGGVVVLLTDDATVRDLNARFRDRDRPTNVLSFPAADMPDTVIVAAPARPAPLMTLETVMADTPARSATARMVTPFAVVLPSHPCPPRPS